MLDVDARAGAVVGHDGGDRLPGGPQVLGADVVRHGPGVFSPDVEEVAEEGVRARTDHQFRKPRRLGHQVQVEGHRCAGAVQDAPHVERGEDVKDREVADRVRVVKAGPDRDKRPPVVTGQGEPVVPEGPGESHDVGRHGPLGIGTRPVFGRLVAVTVAAQVGADHGVLRGQGGGDVPPHQVSLREAVQQHDGAAGAANGGVQPHAVGHGDAFVAEAGDGQGHGKLPLVEDAPL
jgi:hypothetical protein